MGTSSRTSETPTLVSLSTVHFVRLPVSLSTAASTTLPNLGLPPTKTASSATATAEVTPTCPDSAFHGNVRPHAAGVLHRPILCDDVWMPRHNASMRVDAGEPLPRDGVDRTEGAPKQHSPAARNDRADCAVRARVPVARSAGSGVDPGGVRGFV